MKTLIKLAVIGIFSLLICVPSATAKVNVEEVKILIQENKHNEAKTIIKRGLREEPNSPDVQFMYGYHCAWLGKFRTRQIFTKTIELGGSRYKQKIITAVSEIFDIKTKEFGPNNLKHGPIAICLEILHEFSPETRTKYFNTVLELGETYLQDKKMDIADNFFRAIHNVDETWDGKIAQAYYEQGKLLTPDEWLIYFTLVRKYGEKKYNQEIGHMLLVEAQKAHLAGDRERQKIFNDKARGFVDRKTTYQYFHQTDKKWIKISEHSATGKGFGENDHVQALTLGKEYKYKDRVVIYGKNTRVFRDCLWGETRWNEKYQNDVFIFNAVNRTPEKKKLYLYVMAGIDVEVKLEVYRNMVIETPPTKGILAR